MTVNYSSVTGIMIKLISIIHTIMHTKCLRELAGVKRNAEGKWLSNNDLFSLTQSQRLSKTVMQRRWKWAGHVRRMGSDRWPKKLMFGEVVEGKSGKGRPKATWRSVFQKECEQNNVSNWINLSKKRSDWSNIISSLP